MFLCYGLTWNTDCWIIGCSLVAFVVLSCFGNLKTIDAFLFAGSGCTESGLNPVDMKDLYLAQQIVLYIFPIITNICFVNIVVVIVRIRYFRKRLGEFGSLSGVHYGTDLVPMLTFLKHHIF